MSDAGLDALRLRRGRYRVRLTAEDVKTNREALRDLMRMAYEGRNG